MKRTVKGILTALALLSVIICMTVFSASAANDNGKWICAWSTAPTEIGIDGYENITAYIGKVTARTVITPTADGTKLRIRVSNAYGNEAMKLTRVTVAKSLGGSKIDTNSVKIVTFNEGQQFVSVPAGKEYYSDPVVFDVVAGEDIAISIYIENFTEIKTMGLSGGDTYLGLSDDYTSKDSLDFGTMMDNEELMNYLLKITGSPMDFKLAFSFVKVVPCLASMDVLSDENAYSVVVVGDSTVSNEFPEYLADAIHEKGFRNVGVAGKGIIGNRLLGDGLGYGSLIFGESLIDRFQRDVLSQSGVEYVIIKIGANDIIHPVCSDVMEIYPGIKQPTWQEIALGYRKLFQMCHNAGIKVIAVSITPWKGSTRDYLGSGAKYVRTDAEFEADWKIAQMVNTWLAATTEHDGFVDLNEFSANPKDPAAFYPEYTIDGIHPSDTMQREWGNRFPHSIIGVGKTVAGLRLSRAAITAYVGAKGVLLADIYPSTAENKNVIWTSSNPSVISVTDRGVLECLSAGDAVITCKTEDGGYEAYCNVKIFSKPTSVVLSTNKAALYTTKGGMLTATVLPADAYDKRILWTSSNTQVATVDQNGRVTAVGSGVAVITAKTYVGGVTAQCTVTVLKKTEVASIALNRATGTLLKGYSYRLTSSVYPENATFKNVTWTSSNPKVLTVDQNGIIKGVSAGKAVIVCRSVDNPRAIATCNVTVIALTTGVKLNASVAAVYAGYSGYLKATVLPADATDKRVIWTSSDKSVATVNANGLVTGVKPGKAVITCTTVNGNHKATCELTVVPVIGVTSVTLNRNTGYLYAGTYYQFVATVKPDNASIKKLLWTSSDTSVLRVDANGKILAVKPGVAVITCKSLDGGKTATCTVRVLPVEPTSVQISPANGTLNYGQSYQLKATVYPVNATDKRVTWASSNPKIVSVSSTGVIRALTPNATAVITAKTVSGGKVATCTIKVRPLAVTGVALNYTRARLGVGYSGRLIAKVYPTNATNKAVTWKSLNPAIATVDQNGIVTGKAAGTTTIYCTTKDGGYTAACQLSVEFIGVRVNGVKLNKTLISGKVGTYSDLVATIVPSNATNKAVKWTTSDSTVAIVNQNGRVFLIGKGECQIQVTTSDGSYIALCKVIAS